MAQITQTSASSQTISQNGQTNLLPVPLDRNPGMPLDMDWVMSLTVNRSAVERRADTFTKRRTVKKEFQAAYLIRAIECIDLTTLSGDDTPGNVHRLCAKAINPLANETRKALGIPKIHTGAVCVYHQYVAEAVRLLAGTGIPVAAVSTGFPAGLSPFKQRLEEIHQSVKDGAHEIDIVITRAHVLRGDWQALYEEMQAFREACGEAHVKAILATGELGTLTNVARASAVCMMAGADFIKTSTGKEPTNATLPYALVMARLIREYQERTNIKIGFKPAGGIRTAKQATEYLMLMKDELGNEWLSPHLFRIGASTLLADIERQLEHHLSGRYSAFNRHPMG
ncbi:MAG: deoxyribose-phosphate aldolase [Fimbriimonadaceae bacterium]|nr:MAG: deoxyribose-phosphate aldolase [Fimbriimonadaceae bacterium]